MTPVCRGRRAVAAVITPVVRITPALIRCRIGRSFLPQFRDAMGPRIVRADSYPSCRAPLHRQEQSVVARIAARIDVVDVTESLRSHGIGESEPSTGIEVRRV